MGTRAAVFKAVFLFEIRHHLRQPLFYLATFFVSLLIFLAATRGGVGSAVGKVNLNAPVVSMSLLTQGGGLGLLAVIAFVAGAGLRDFDRRTSELFFTKPVLRLDFLTARFAGSLALCLLMYLICTVTLAVSTFVPWLDPARVGPFRLAPYVFALGILLVPTLFSVGAVSFALAGWTRSMPATYLGVVGFFALNTLSRILASQFESETLGQLLDPFGMEALLGAIKYWTIAERNTLIPDFGGVLLYNRVLWSGLGLLALGLCLATFDPSRAKSRSRKRREVTEQPAPERGARDSSLPAATSAFSRAAIVTQFLHQTRLEVLGVFRSVPFLGMLAFGLFIVVGSAASIGRQFGTGVHPLTHFMVQAVQGGYAILLVIVVVLYSGEVIWKERSLKLSEIYDTKPTASALHLGAKLTALVLIVAAFLSCGVAATIGFQIWSGHRDFELGLHLQGALIAAVYPVLLCFLACFFQIVSRNKFMGYALVLVFMLSWDLIEEFGFEHHLYRFASLPPTSYSDMSGHGNFLTPFLWYSLYWAFASVVLIGLSVAFWKRGTDTSWKTRWLEARVRLRGPIRRWVAVGALGFVATGSWIFYNTNVLNAYVPSDETMRLKAAYETKYRQYKDVAVPLIQAIQADVDIFPSERRVEIRGTYRIKNEGSEPIRNLHFNLSDKVGVNRLDLPAHRVQVQDDLLGYYIYELVTPLDPGEEAVFGFDLTVAHRGFVNNGSSTSVVANGTFFDNRDFFPILGYTDRKELLDPDVRRRHGLVPAHPFAKIDDDVARHHTPRGVDADWVTFETTVSTRSDQIAVAPGFLNREWSEGDRRYFHYVAHGPIPHLFAYMSARYKVTRKVWGGVAIEVYHHPGHEYNVDRMLDAAKRTLDYCSTNFSIYQHRQLRIVEIPRHAELARSFPGTIAFSEGLGFVARLDEEGDDGEDGIDYPFYVTAHEVAHQWWGHQVVPADVQGAAMLAETMAQYVALMVMERAYGPENMRRFLKYELDAYLRDRGREEAEETPLSLVELQDHVYYHKGSLAMYALQDQLGEERLNRALAVYVANVAFQEPPFTTTFELLAEIRRIVPQGSERLVEDLFERITLFDNEIVEATCTRQPDGTYSVRVDARARKLRANGEGVETETPIDDWIDIGIFGVAERDGKNRQRVLFLERRRITEERVVFDIVVDARPTRAAIDPYNKLVDRDSDDNLLELPSCSP